MNDDKTNRYDKVDRVGIYERVEKNDSTEKNDSIEKNDSVEKNDKVFTVRRVIYYILGILESTLVFRLVFKILGANPDSGFISVIYSITQVLLIPFTAIFRTAVTQGIEAQAVLEPSVIIAMVVYALIAYGIVKLIVVIRGYNKSGM